jgi:uncharacterized membrane protein (UPF0127 family)
VKNFFFLIVGLVIVSGSIFLFLERKTINVNETRIIKIGDTSVRVEVADTFETRAKGLSGRESLPDGRGVLFVFDKSDRYGFWMKNMNFAIDIVWIAEGFEVVGITEEVAPETFPEIFYPPEPVKYVLELPGGKSRNSGIDIGAFMYLE